VRGTGLSVPRIRKRTASELLKQCRKRLIVCKVKLVTGNKQKLINLKDVQSEELSRSGGLKKRNKEESKVSGLRKWFSVSGSMFH
jgi:hypothetical protein